MENKKSLPIYIQFIIAVLCLSVFNYCIYGWDWDFEIIGALIGCMLIILIYSFKFILNYRRLSKSVVIDFDNKQGLVEYPKKLPLPRIGDKMSVNNDPVGFQIGFVYAVVHCYYGNAHQIRIHVGKYGRIQEYRDEQLKIENYKR